MSDTIAMRVRFLRLRAVVLRLVQDADNFVRREIARIDRKKIYLRYKYIVIPYFHKGSYFI
jgi:hypothetical protein